MLEPLEPRLMLSGTSYVVNSRADTVASDGFLTLREAIQAANTNTAVNEAHAGSGTDVDTITFAPSLFASGPATIRLSGTELVITDDLTITGPGEDLLAIYAAGHSRVLRIEGGGTVVALQGLGITGGSTTGEGGGLYVAGATVTLSDCTVSGNWAATAGGGLYANSGSTVTLTNSTVSGNSSYWGGGVDVYGGTVVLTNSTVSGNLATSVGGGLYANSGSTVTLTNSTVSGNSASFGGGLYVYDGGTVVLTNSTVSGNLATDYGGGLLVYGTVTLTNCTVSGNSASYGGGGLYVDYSNTVTLNNTIVAMNAGMVSPDIQGMYVGSANFVGGDPGFIRNPAPGSDGVWGTGDDDPGNLHLRPDSPCVNAGVDALAVDSAGNPLTIDLDGAPRIYGPHVDMGAYEYRPVTGRIFYNGSSFDGNDLDASPADDAAIDHGKHPLLPGGTASPVNWTSYSRGINGVIVDILVQAGTPVAGDFAFKVGNSSDPFTWAAAPAPLSITVRTDAAENGGDRVTIIWADNDIHSQWLQVTVLSDAHGGHLGLAGDEVFYFGNLPGDATGDGTTDYLDYLALKESFGAAGGATPLPADFDRSGDVGQADLSCLGDSFGQQLVFGWQAPASASEFGSFPDPNLEAAIRDAIGKATGDIMASDLASLTDLYASFRGIVDLTGLEYCTSLQTLDLSGNQISDLTPLAGLTGLWSLSLDYNAISDLRPLAGLTGLSALSLGGNAISDLTPLAGLTGLGNLSLGSNAISDLTPLTGLTGLDYLYLNNNAISDLTPLAGLTGLSGLSLGNNAISDLTPLAGLTGVSYLDMAYNAISNLTPLAGMTGLTQLHLAYNAISDLTPLAGLTGVSYLWLDGNRISDLTPLTGLTGLTHLYLAYNAISDLTPLAGLARLSYLDLGNNAISDLVPLGGLTGLSYLDVTYNEISDLSPLTGLTGLLNVTLSSNPLWPSSFTTEIPALQAAGARVWYDAPGQISGTVFDDQNHNGVRDAGEPGMEGVTVFLDRNGNNALDWIDADGQGDWDQGEGERWAISGADGSYTFDYAYSFANGHDVSQVIPTGWIQTTPTSPSHHHVVLQGNVVTGLDFGLSNELGPPVVPIEMDQYVGSQIPARTDDSYGSGLPVAGTDTTGGQFILPWGHAVEIDNPLPADWGGGAHTSLLPPASSEDAPDADVLAAAAIALGDRLVAGRQDVPPPATPNTPAIPAAEVLYGFPATSLAQPGAADVSNVLAFAALSRRTEALAAAWQAPSLPPVGPAGRSRPVPMSSLPMRQGGTPGRWAGDVLQQAATTRSDDAAGRETGTEPWAAKLAVEIADNPRKGRLGRIGLACWRPGSNWLPATPS